ncbi:MAG: M48 family metallopeptidase [Pseudomonadota bacterium]
MRFLGAFVAAILIPALAVGIAVLPFWQGGVQDPAMLFEIWRTCLTDGSSSPDLSELCSTARPTILYGAIAAATGFIGLFLILLVQFGAWTTGWNRTLLAFTFPPLAFIALLACGLVAIAQAGLVAGGVYFLEAYLFGSVHLAIVIVVGIIGLVAGVGVVMSALGMFKSAGVNVIGLPIRPIDAPHLHRVIGSICRQLNTKPPKQVVVGLDANFFATSAHVHTPFDKQPMRGQTLYMSLPLLRMLTEEEVKSVIGHEMAHFSGGDTAYSKRFAPVYRGLYGAMNRLSEGGGGGIMAAPAKLILGFMLDAFSRIERRIGRKRETRADAIGAEAGSAEALSSALLKVSVFSAIWQAEFEEMIGRVKRGRFSRNLSRNFVDRTRYDIDHDKISGLAVLGIESEVPHPTDSHPVTIDRITALGLDPDVFSDTDRLKASIMPERTLIARSDSIEALEERLTDVYQQIIAHQAGVSEDKGVQNETAFSNLLSMFLASITLADGSVDDREIEVAQEEAFKYDPAFDPVSFKEYCRHPDDLPSTEKLLYWGNMMLTPQGADRLKAILHKIAAADDHIDAGEKALLDLFDEELVGMEDTGEPAPAAS